MEVAEKGFDFHVFVGNREVEQDTRRLMFNYSIVVNYSVGVRG